MCQGRAVAHGRLAVGRFADPVAERLLRPDEHAIVTALRSGTPPDDWRDGIEHEMVATASEVAAARTVGIDDAIRAHPTAQIVILGAGLDGRAWRMPELASAAVFEVDHPASQADKRDRIGDIAPTAATVRFVPVDLGRDSLDDALGGAGHESGDPTTWVWEGVIPYLTRPEVEATLSTVADRSAPGSRLILTHVTPTHTLGLGRAIARLTHRVAGRPDPFAREPLRSFWRPDDMRRLLEGQGFTVTSDRSLISITESAAGAIRRRRALTHGRVVVADR
jgi:methyltransferase (TIGR00027 family)